MSLLIKNLFAFLGEKEILKGINLEVKPARIAAIMGPNGSGKSTLAQVIMGNPAYTVSHADSQIQIDGQDILQLKPEERAKKGVFLAFQNPIAIPGVNIANLLRTAFQAIKYQRGVKGQKKMYNPALSVWEFNEFLLKKAKELALPSDFLKRSLNEEFSGGEKKKLEMLQALVLGPKYAIFDEIDTGLDIDALKIVGAGINQLKKTNCGILVITHYQRILKFAQPDEVYILVKGKIVASGGFRLAKEVEKYGYRKWIKD